jgi:RNA polymerase sigma-70 factor (ECF subfamily)
MRIRGFPIAMPDGSSVSGQPSAFEQEALAALDSLYRTARRLSRDRSDAEDLVQDTYLKAFRAADTFEPGTNLRAWLFTILLNLDRNRRRGLARRPVLAAIEDADPPGAPGTDGSRGDIERGLALLPHEQREVLLLVTLEGLSYREAAEVQGVPIGTVMSRLSRARTALRTHIEGERPKLRQVK